MDILGWISWLLWKAIGLVWTMVWFLLGGWVSTLAQILVVAGIIFFYRYGWQRAPAELWSRASGLGRFVWAWMRSGEAATRDVRVETRETVRIVRVKEPGDINASTLLTIVMLVEIGLLLSVRL